MNPSPTRAARSNAASPQPPSQIGIGAAGMRQRAGAVDAVEATVERDDRFGPQPAQQLDLFLLARAARFEVLSERLVLDVVPPDADAETNPSARQHVEVGDLARHERGLALRKDQDAGGEPDAAS